MSKKGKICNFCLEQKANTEINTSSFYSGAQICQNCFDALPLIFRANISSFLSSFADYKKKRLDPSKYDFWSGYYVFDVSGGTIYPCGDFEIAKKNIILNIQLMTELKAAMKGKSEKFILIQDGQVVPYKATVDIERFEPVVEDLPEVEVLPPLEEVDDKEQENERLKQIVKEVEESDDVVIEDIPNGMVTRKVEKQSKKSKKK